MSNQLKDDIAAYASQLLAELASSKLGDTPEARGALIDSLNKVTDMLMKYDKLEAILDKKDPGPFEQISIGVT